MERSHSASPETEGSSAREPVKPSLLPLRGHVDLSERILTVSATLVGVCLTVIGLVHVAEGLRKVGSATDEIVAFDAVAFLASCFLAYASIRSRNPRSQFVLERIADAIFLFALLGMVVVCGVLAYEIV